MSVSIDGRYESVLESIRYAPHTWCVTGVAGFIGSWLLEVLLRNDQKVVGIDNFATGAPVNLESVRNAVAERQWHRFRFVDADVRDVGRYQSAMEGVEYVLHQAALGSVPRSIADPRATNGANVDGFVAICMEAKRVKVRKFVFASSSAVYGDSQEVPKREGVVGRPLSPYAITKAVNEVYARLFGELYNMDWCGLRYFNVFGPRQDPNGPYAAVIPRWISAMREGQSITIFGDGETRRDFSYIENVVQANILAAITEGEGEVYNVAVGEEMSLNALFNEMKRQFRECGVDYGRSPEYAEFRRGDVRRSIADIAKAKEGLGYMPSHTLAEGLGETIRWYLKNRG